MSQASTATPSGVLPASSPANSEWRPTPPASKARVIRDDAEALEVAAELAKVFAAQAGERDRHRLLPYAEVEAYSQSGLWGITIPKAYGGAQVSQVTVAKVFALLAAGDASTAQIAQNSFEILEVIRQTGTDAQQREVFGLVLDGYRLGNAFSEANGKDVEAYETRIVDQGDGQHQVSGRKFYSTGALFAHIVPIVALNEAGKVTVALADRYAPGLTVVDDWSAFGQRTTASGSVLIDQVNVPASRVLPAHEVYDNPSAIGPQSQLIHAAIDAGIARGILQATVDFVREQARPWIDSKADKASDDVFTVSAVGDLFIRLHAAEALLERAGCQLDATLAQVDLNSIALAKIAVAEAKVLTTEVALAAANKLFELGGTRSTLQKHNLDRLWRDARTHTLHDPVRWKPFAVGQFYLNGVHPPLHSWI